MVISIVIFILLIIYYFFLLILLHSNKCDKYVQLSASSIYYIAYIPVVVKAWKLIGFCSIVILISHNLTKQIIFVKNILTTLGSEVTVLQINKNISLHYASKITRIFGFIISNKYLKNDYFLLSDCDIIPLSYNFFRDLNYNKLTIKSVDINGYGYGANKGRWAMCYMVANKFIWNDILKNDIINNNLKSTIYRVIENEILKGEKYFESYQYIDEVYMRDKIKEWKYYNSNILFHKRDYKNTRIDRSKWPNNVFLINKSNVIDIHLPKLNENVINIWKKKIIPLEQFIFKLIPYDMNYIYTLLILQ